MATVEVIVRPAASSYAVFKSFLAVVSSPASVTRHAPVYPPSLSYIVPVTSPQVNTVIEAPPFGYKPTCPVIMEVRTSEIAEPPRTAKLSAVKRSILAVDANAFGWVVGKAEVKIIREIKITRGIKTSNAMNFILFKIFIKKHTALILSSMREL